MTAPAKQPASPPLSAPDVIRVPEIRQPSPDSTTVDCPMEMPAKEAI
ncbi:hypothetical protein [[Clostridium] polysaccharolyticum]|uniref:Uncharacterized protein n=1 Tax=[Clostridium] polysaccharolyticum TaxID=29364 RepID=A0A1I0AZ19_9FIRM|nr:hypothetical protein [[Clostridium] polysaccharolyticum]SES99627.1 hypothetical protein SAMN04487772_106101 [[Clostridium] polysaccharolyticum]